MTRMGHDSPDAALIYQHATSQADRAIADAMNGVIDEANNDDDSHDEDPDDGSAGVPANPR